MAPATINLRLAAVRRLAYEASDNGLLSPDLAAGIRRVKDAKRLGIRLSNWLTSTQGGELLGVPDRASVKGKRNYAMLAVLLGCGLRRSDPALVDSSDDDDQSNVGNRYCSESVQPYTSFPSPSTAPVCTVSFMRPDTKKTGSPR
jgi:site-specific recombinase XerD